MITEEIFQSIMQDRMVEGARLRTERRAKAVREEGP
jgi:hypothetical protein